MTEKICEAREYCPSNDKESICNACPGAPLGRTEYAEYEQMEIELKDINSLVIEAIELVEMEKQGLPVDHNFGMISGYAKGLK